MRHTNLPVVIGDKTDSGISVGSNEWFQWLEQISSFRYKATKFTHLGDLTVRKRNGSYWYAFRMVKNNLRTYYVGKTSDVSYERLQLAVDELNLSNTDYRNLIDSRKPVAREDNKTKLSNSTQATELAQENALLKTQITELQEQLATIQSERDELLKWKETYILYMEDQNRQLEAIHAKLKLAQMSTRSTDATKVSHSKPTCPECGSTGNHVNKGIRNNKRRWLCVDCGKSFSVDIGAA